MSLLADPGGFTILNPHPVWPAGGGGVYVAPGMATGTTALRAAEAAAPTSTSFRLG